MSKKIKEVFLKKDSGAKEIIVEVGLVVVAVFLIVAFRTEINNIMTSVFKTASETITKLFNAG